MPYTCEFVYQLASQCTFLHLRAESNECVTCLGLRLLCQACRCVSDGSSYYSGSSWASTAKLHRAHAVAALQVFVSAIYLALLVPGVALLRLYLYGWGDAWAWALIALLAALSTVPLPWLDGTLPHRLMGLIVGSACNYFPISVRLEASDPRGPHFSLQQAVRLVPICTLQPDKWRFPSAC